MIFAKKGKDTDAKPEREKVVKKDLATSKGVLHNLVSLLAILLSNKVITNELTIKVFVVLLVLP